MLSVVVLGTIWYSVVEGIAVLDAAYLSVITLSTVGFEEVHPLDTSGRVFTIFFIVGGIGITAYAATAIVEEVIVAGVADRLSGGSPARRVRRMRGHTIVCGFGRVGEEISRELRGRNIPVVVIEQDAARAEAARAIGCLAVVGDATEQEQLSEAGVERARALIAAADSDVGNTYIVLSSRSTNPDLLIIARAGSDTAQARLITAGANHVVSPYRIAGRRMALTAIQPMIVDFVDRLSGAGEGADILAEILVTAESHVAGETIREAFAGGKGVRVLALRRADGELVVGPAGEARLHLGDRLMLFGPQTAIESLSVADGTPARRTEGAGSGPLP